MNYAERAEAYIWEYLDDNGWDTEYISTGRTLDSLLNDGWTYTDIILGGANRFIGEHIVEL